MLCSWLSSGASVGVAHKWLAFSFPTGNICNGMIMCPEFKISKRREGGRELLQQEPPISLSSVLHLDNMEEAIKQDFIYINIYI